MVDRQGHDHMGMPVQMGAEGPRGSGCLPPGGAAGLISSLALMADSVDVKGAPEVARASPRVRPRLHSGFQHGCEGRARGRARQPQGAPRAKGSPRPPRFSSI